MPISSALNAAFGAEIGDLVMFNQFGTDKHIKLFFCKEKKTNAAFGAEIRACLSASAYCS